MGHTLDISFNASATQAQKDAIINNLQKENPSVVDEATAIAHVQSLVTSKVHKYEQKEYASAYTPTDLTVA